MVFKMTMLVNETTVAHVTATNIDPNPNGNYGANEMRQYRIDWWLQRAGGSAIQATNDYVVALPRVANPIVFAANALQEILKVL